MVQSSLSSLDKENVAAKSKLVEIKDKIMESVLHVPTPELDFQGISRLITVRGQ